MSDERVEYILLDSMGRRYDGYPVLSLQEAETRRREYDVRWHAFAPFRIVKRTIVEEPVP